MPRRKPNSLFMGTTDKPAYISIGDITRTLVAFGAKSITSDYDKDGRITGMVFGLETPLGIYHYSLPARSEFIYQRLRSERKRDRGGDSEKKDKEQAERVAWRQLLRWIEAQLALVQTGMSDSGEVFFPYLQRGDGQSMYRAFQVSEQKRLAAPDAKP